MKAAYKYQVHGVRYQICCNDNGNWYRRNTSLNGGDYTPWQKIPAPRITGGCLKVGNSLKKVEAMTFEPFDLPKN